MTTDLDKDHKAWLDELTLELRLKDVSGRDIGDAVATAREFLRDSGTSAEEAFGSPREYADALALAPAPDAERGVRRAVLGGLLVLLGFFAVVYAGGPAWRGESVELDASTVALLLLAALLVLLIPRYLSTVMHAAPWRIGLGAAVVFAVQVLIAFTLGDVTVASLPALPIALVGAVVLVGEVGWLARQDDDPLQDPLEPQVRTHVSPLVRMLPGLVSCVAAVGFVVLDVMVGG
ncbi:hypothetical protein [Nocardioides houyundeii]|uniref:hypothetical protein n=1 Tax=Nocardioides houyundeii TaxID=2045452 RepID=UPI000C77C0E2|nr:hypothetical protein [Nocardioides houyundeii]